MTSTLRSAAPGALPFLLSLVAMPACGPAVEDDPTIPDGGEPEKFQQSCRAAHNKVFSCYEDAYGEEYEGDYDPAAYAEELCAEYEGYAREYGDGCVGAYEEVFACLASLSCATLTSDDWGGDYPSECDAVLLDAHEQCPEAFPACSGGSSGFGPEACDTSSGTCNDGHRYAVACVADGDNLACTCSIDGEDTSTTSVTGTCSSGAWEDLEEVCGFPDFTG